MNKYLVRFNKTRGMPGRGSKEHVWRVFENDHEYLAKHFILNVRSWAEHDGVDYNVACEGYMQFFHDTDTVVINAQRHA